MTRRILLALLVAATAALPGTARAQDPSFTLVNNTGRVIQEVYATNASRRDWGYDRLGTEVIQPGRSHAVRVAYEGECVLDVRIVTADGGQEDRRGIDTCRARNVVFGPGGAAGAPAGRPDPRAEGRGGRGAEARAQAGPGGGNPSFNLLNRSDVPIREVYASPASRRDWGTDLLGRATLPPGRSFAVRLPVGECSYDLRIVYDGGGAEERRGLNTCDLSTVPFP